MLRRLVVLMLILSFLTLPYYVLAQGDTIEPVPPGTPFGEITIIVIDCETREPITGADITLENPSHSVNVVMTGENVTVEVYQWWYSYSIQHEDYMPASGVKKFKIGLVYEFCLIPRARGEWRVSAEILRVGGDIHPGGEGWILVRIRNLETGFFRIHQLRAYVEGFEEPILVKNYQQPLLLPANYYIDVNLTVKPPSTAPTGRLKTELFMKATFYYDENRWVGPLGVYVDMDVILLKRFRTLRFDVADYWGLNVVPDITVVMRGTLPGAETEHVFYSSNGTVFVEKLSDIAYRIEVYYNSPYDGKQYLIRQVTKRLLDLAREEHVKTNVADVKISVRTLDKKPLGGASVSLGQVKILTDDEGVAVFHNVPRGSYPVKVSWEGVEVYSSNVTAGLPSSPAIGSPGAELEVVADVGGFAITLLDAFGEKLGVNATVVLRGPVQRQAASNSSVTFSLLPRGEYKLEFYVFNQYLRREVKVADETLRIPEDHGKHEVKLSVYDLTLKFVDMSGEVIPVETVEIEEQPYDVANGVLTLVRATPGSYRLYAEWMNVSVLDDVVEVKTVVEDAVEVRLSVYDPLVTVTGLDGLPLSSGKLTITSGSINASVEIVNGTAQLENLPDTSYSVEIRYRDMLVLETGIEHISGEMRLKANVAELVIKVVNQFNQPVSGVTVAVEDMRGVTNEDGEARLGQLPLGEYKAQVIYRDVKALTRDVKLEKPGVIQVSLPLYKLRVDVLNELGAPLDVDATLYSMGTPIASARGSTLEFSNLPVGTYQLTLRKGTKEINKIIPLPGDKVEQVTFPVALEIGNIYLSLWETMLIALPFIIAAVAVVSTVVIRAVLRRIRQGEEE